MSKEIRIRIYQNPRKHKKGKKIEASPAPTKEEIDQALKDYLAQGGRIRKVEPLFLDDYDYTF